MKILSANVALLALLSASVAGAAESRTELAPPDPAAPANIARMSQGYSYFNLPGADRALHDREVKACVATADAAASTDALIGNDGGLVAGVLSSGPKKAVFAAAVENCMVVKGWRVAMLQPAEGQALAAGTVEQIADGLAPWIGADAPPHPVVRVWNNEAARASTTRYEMRPNFIDQGSLSVVAATGGKAGGASGFRASASFAAAKLDKTWPRKPLTPAQVAAAPPGAAIVLFHIKGVSTRNGALLTFHRQWIDDRTPPSSQDRAPDVMTLAQGLLGAKPEGRLVAMALPPGRWRLASMGMLPAVNFCLGSPSFEAAAGEVVYAGAFDLTAEDLSPDLDLTPARTFLAGLPAADRVKPAAYTNGSTGACGDSALYAVEFTDAPFHQGYAGGSRAPKTAAAVAESPAVPVNAVVDVVVSGYLTVSSGASEAIVRARK